MGQLGSLGEHIVPALGSSGYPELSISGRITAAWGVEWVGGTLLWRRFLRVVVEEAELVAVLQVVVVLEGEGLAVASVAGGLALLVGGGSWEGSVHGVGPLDEVAAMATGDLMVLNPWRCRRWRSSLLANLTPCSVVVAHPLGSWAVHRCSVEATDLMAIGMLLEEESCAASLVVAPSLAVFDRSWDAVSGSIDGISVAGPRR